MKINTLINSINSQNNLFKTVDKISKNMGKTQSRISNIAQQMSRTNDSSKLTELSGSLQKQSHKFEMLSIAQRMISNILKNIRDTIMGIIQNFR